MDNRCKVRVAVDDDQRHILEEIDGEAVDPNRKYVTAVDYNMLKGMDGILPITQFARNNVDDIPPEDAAIPIKGPYLFDVCTKARTEPQNVDRRTRPKIQALYLKNHKKFL